MVSSVSAGQIVKHGPGPSLTSQVSVKEAKIERFTYTLSGAYSAYANSDSDAKDWVRRYCKLTEASDGLPRLEKYADGQLAATQARWWEQEQAARQLNARLAGFACMKASPRAASLLYQQIDAESALAEALKASRLGRDKKDLLSLRDEKSTCERDIKAARERVKDLKDRRADAKRRHTNKKGQLDPRARIEPSREKIRRAREDAENLESDIQALTDSIVQLEPRINSKEAALEPQRKLVADLAQELRSAGVSERDEAAIKPLLQDLEKIYLLRDQFGAELDQGTVDPGIQHDGAIVFFGPHSAQQLRYLMEEVSTKLNEIQHYIHKEIKRLHLSRTNKSGELRSVYFKPVQSHYDFTQAEEIPPSQTWMDMMEAEDGQPASSLHRFARQAVEEAARAEQAEQEARKPATSSSETTTAQKTTDNLGDGHDSPADASGVSSEDDSDSEVRSSDEEDSDVEQEEPVRAPPSPTASTAQAKAAVPVKPQTAPSPKPATVAEASSEDDSDSEVRSSDEEDSDVEQEEPIRALPSPPASMSQAKAAAPVKPQTAPSPKPATVAEASSEDDSDSEVQSSDEEDSDVEEEEPVRALPSPPASMSQAKAAAPAKPQTAPSPKPATVAEASSEDDSDSEVQSSDEEDSDVEQEEPVRALPSPHASTAQAKAAVPVKPQTAPSPKSATVAEASSEDDSDSEVQSSDEEDSDVEQEEPVRAPPSPTASTGQAKAAVPVKPQTIPTAPPSASQKPATSDDALPRVSAQTPPIGQNAERGKPINTLPYPVALEEDKVSEHPHSSRYHLQPGDARWSAWPSERVDRLQPPEVIDEDDPSPPRGMLLLTDRPHVDPPPGQYRLGAETLRKLGGNDVLARAATAPAMTSAPTSVQEVGPPPAGGYTMSAEQLRGLGGNNVPRRASTIASASVASSSRQDAQQSSGGYTMNASELRKLGGNNVPRRASTVRPETPASSSAKNAAPAQASGSYAMGADELRNRGESNLPRRASTMPSARQPPVSEQPLPRRSTAPADHGPRSRTQVPRPAPAAFSPPLDLRLASTHTFEWNWLPMTLAHAMSDTVRAGYEWTTIQHVDLNRPFSGVLKTYYLIKDRIRNDLVFDLSPPGTPNPIKFAVLRGDPRFHVLEILPPLVFVPPGAERNGVPPMPAPDGPLHFYSDDPMSPRYRDPKLRGNTGMPSMNQPLPEEPPLPGEDDGDPSKYRPAQQEVPRRPRQRRPAESVHEPEQMSEEQFWQRRTKHRTPKPAETGKHRTKAPRGQSGRAEPVEIAATPIVLRDSNNRRVAKMYLLGQALHAAGVAALLRPSSSPSQPLKDEDVAKAMQKIVDNERLFSKERYPDAAHSLANATKIIDGLVANGFDLRMLRELKEDLGYLRNKIDGTPEPAAFLPVFADYAQRRARQEIYADDDSRRAWRAMDKDARAAELERRCGEMKASNEDFKTYLKQKYSNVFHLDLNESVFEQILGRIQIKLNTYISQLAADAVVKELADSAYSAEQKQSLLHNLKLQQGEITERAVAGVPAFKQLIEQRVDERLRELETQEPDKVNTAEKRRVQRDNLTRDVMNNEGHDIHERYLAESEHAALLRPIWSQFPINDWRAVLKVLIPKLEQA
ncbi:MAG: hypothetical protein GAK35_02824 [Herbaspirillum frisingense]|uniref:Uncharacterized protein n=1 Tax=Herbaspirillum frisingense TaxID=92645 RepID=A0A7V8FVD8_9BURK|nr:MAG: hypothetical protein GAK35_02824 [Herbaspirillum frisingense]